jgi:hypothetical protein
MPGRLVHDDDFRNLGLLISVATVGCSGPAKSQFVMPSAVGVVLANPANVETDGEFLFIQRVSSKDHGIPVVGPW